MGKNRIKLISIVLIILFFSMIFSSCSNEGGEDEKIEDEKEYEKVYGGEIKLPISTVKSMNPLLSENESLYSFYDLIYEGLFRFKDDHNIENVLAEEYTIKNSGRTIDIKIKDNIKWHDGEDFTAKDVKYTLDLLRHTFKTKEYRDILSQYDRFIKPEDIEHIYSIKVIDEKNIVIDFDRSFSNALETLIFPIFPSHQFKAEEANASYDNFLETKEKFKPIGTGKYKFVDYNEEKNISLTKNDEWWQEEKPYIENVKGVILKENKFNQAFKEGDLDLIKTTFKNIDTLNKNKDIKSHKYVSNDFDFLGFNFNNDKFKKEEGKAIRKAIAYAIDRDKIIEKVYDNNAKRSILPILNNSYLSEEDENLYKHDIKQAKKILKDAGFKKSGDKKLKFKLITNSNDKYREETSDMIVKDLNEIGIEIEKEYEENIDELVSKIDKSDFDIALLGLELSESPDLAFAFHSQSIESGTNFISYSNEKMDKLLVEEFNSVKREDKKDKYIDIQNLLIEDLPYVGLFFTENALVMDEKIKGDINPMEYGIYNDIEKWFIPEELQENK